MIPKHKQVRLKGKAMQELVKAVYRITGRIPPYLYVGDECRLFFY